MSLRDARPVSIGKAAKLANVGVETIRFYEREGIITKPLKHPGSVRAYPLDTVKRLRFIKRAQDLGFTLQEITDLLAVRAIGKGTCSNVRTRADEKIAQIESKIADLKKIQRALAEIRDCCEQRLTADRCPILESFYA